MLRKDSPDETIRHTYVSSAQSFLIIVFFFLNPSDLTSSVQISILSGFSFDTVP